MHTKQHRKRVYKEVKRQTVIDKNGAKHIIQLRDFDGVGSVQLKKFQYNLQKKKNYVKKAASGVV